ARPRRATSRARARRRGDRVKRREFITLIGGAAAAWPFAAHAQQSNQIRRVAALVANTLDDPESALRHAAFERGLQELGWVIGRNVQLEYRFAGRNADDIRKNAAELVAGTPDVILATSSVLVAALQQLTRTVPIVFAAV